MPSERKMLTVLIRKKVRIRSPTKLAPRLRDEPIEG